MAEQDVPRLLRQWLTGRSRARGLPLPVADWGGWRIDTGSPAEPRRYVFAEPRAEIAALASSTIDPRIPLKLCATPDALAALLPAGWSAAHTGTMMTIAAATVPASALPPGCSIEREVAERAGTAKVRAPDGSLAASGFCGWSATHFVYDRIVTDPAWQRRGLGRAIMHELGAFMAARSRVGVLVATDAGRALYRTLGWRDVCPYSTATFGR